MQCFEIFSHKKLPTLPSDDVFLQKWWGITPPHMAETLLRFYDGIYPGREVRPRLWAYFFTKLLAGRQGHVLDISGGNIGTRASSPSSRPLKLRSCAGGFGALVAADHCRLSWIGVEPCHDYYSRLEPVQRRLTHYAVTEDKKHYDYKDENTEARECMGKRMLSSLGFPRENQSNIIPLQYYHEVKKVNLSCNLSPSCTEFTSFDRAGLRSILSRGS